jgi:predicted Ser/Thr protein kinase
MSASPPGSSPHRRLAGLRPELLMAQGMEALAEDLPGIAGLEILSTLGRGGMGTVYLARQAVLDREVAVKVVTRHAAGDAHFLERLEREARTMARLSHPNLVVAHDFQRVGEDSAAIVMEYVSGGSLRERIERYRRGLPLHDALRWAREAASALAAAHAAGIIHRDLKPENVLIDPAGAARVSDFGVAVSTDLHATRLTLTGTTVGTLDYMPPERFRDGEPDVRGDVYSLGVMVYEMLTGVVPRGSFPPPHKLRAEVPAGVSRATMRALRADPGERFPSMEEFRAALGSSSRLGRRAWLAGGAVAAFSAAGGWWRFGRDSAVAQAAFAPVAAKKPPEKWRDLLGPVDIARDRISGGWKRDGDHLLTDESVCILSLAGSVPTAYDIRTTFVRETGKYCIGVFFTMNGRMGSVDIDGWDLDLAGVQSVDGKDLRNTQNFLFPLETGRCYELTVEVRPGKVRIVIDGVEQAVIEIGDKPLGVVSPWAWNPSESRTGLAIGSFESSTRFKTVEWRPAGME